MEYTRLSLAGRTGQRPVSYCRLNVGHKEARIRRDLVRPDIVKHHDAEKVCRRTRIGAWIVRRVGPWADARRASGSQDPHVPVGAEGKGLRDEAAPGRPYNLVRSAPQERLSCGRTTAGGRSSRCRASWTIGRPVRSSQQSTKSRSEVPRCRLPRPSATTAEHT